MNLTPTAGRPRRWQRLGGLLAIPAALLASTLLVWDSSSAALQQQTQTAPNDWVAGHVEVSQGLAGRVMFDEHDLLLGDAGERCVVVSYTGDLAADVRFLVSGLGAADTLAPYLELTLEQGTGGSDGDCTGFAADGSPITAGGTLADLGGASTFTTGLGSWAPPGAESRTYRIAWRLRDDNAAQGLTASVGFVWVAHSAP